MRSRSSPAQAPARRPWRSAWMRSIIRRRIAHSSGSRLPGVRCSTETKTSRGNSPYAICAGLPVIQVSPDAAGLRHWLLDRRELSQQLFGYSLPSPDRPSSGISRLASFGHLLALARLLVQVIRPSHTHRFLDVQFMFRKRYGWYGTGGLFRPRRTYRSEHLLLDHRPAFARLCQSALDWDPLSASKRDPFERRTRPVALAASELAGVAETVRARVV